MTPVAVYPKGYIDQLQIEVNQLKADIKNGKKPVFENLDALFADLNRPLADDEAEH